MKTIIFRPHKCYPPSNAAHYFDSLRLEPGSKQYSENDVAQLLAHPDYPRYQAWDAIEILEPKVEIQTEQPSSGLSIYSADQAEKVIQSCHDLATLQGWLKDEKRTTVRQTINRRIAAIKRGEE